MACGQELLSLCRGEGPVRGRSFEFLMDFRAGGCQTAALWATPSRPCVQLPVGTCRGECPPRREAAGSSEGFLLRVLHLARLRHGQPGVGGCPRNGAGGFGPADSPWAGVWTRLLGALRAL